MPARTKTLPNGLRLVTAPVPGAASATALVLVKVGSRYEPAGINGAAHFVEHMLFKGTESRPTSLDISRELERVGAHFNAFTDKDHTGYYVKAAGRHLAMSFDVLSDMVWNSTFDPAELDKERGVIVEEINMYDDNPLISIGKNFEQVLFTGPARGGGLSQDIAGPKRVIKTISRDRLHGFKQAYYQPANMVVAVAGRFSQAAVEKLVRERFGRAGGKKFKKHARFSSSQRSPRVQLEHKPTQQVHMALGVPGLPYGHADADALAVLSTVLGGNMSSRLFVKIREEHGLAYSVHAGAAAYGDAGSFYVQSGLDRSRIRPAIGLILEELARARRDGITAEELAEAQEFLAGSITLKMEDSESVANWYGKQQLLLGKTRSPEQRIAAIRRVTRARVGALARRLIRGDRLNLAVVGPFRDAGCFRKLLKLPS